MPAAEAAFFESFLDSFAPWVHLSLVEEKDPVIGDTSADGMRGYERVRYDVVTADERVRDDVDFVFHMDSDSTLVRHLLWTDLFADGGAVPVGPIGGFHVSVEPPIRFIRASPAEKRRLQRVHPVDLSITLKIYKSIVLYFQMTTLLA